MPLPGLFHDKEPFSFGINVTVFCNEVKYAGCQIALYKEYWEQDQYVEVTKKRVNRNGQIAINSTYFAKVGLKDKYVHKSTDPSPIWNLRTIELSKTKNDSLYTEEDLIQNGILVNTIKEIEKKENDKNESVENENYITIHSLTLNFFS